MFQGAILNQHPRSCNLNLTHARKSLSFTGSSSNGQKGRQIRYPRGEQYPVYCSGERFQ